jgi:hypothetical protein
MADNAISANAVGISIRSVERDRDPRIIDAGVRALSGSLANLSGLDPSRCFGIRRSLRADAAGGQGGDRPDTQFLTGIQFEAPLEKVRTVLRCLGDWLDRTRQSNQFEVTVPPAHTLTLQTDQARELAQLLPLVELLLPSQTTYLALAQRYVETFGELTPAAKASLALAQHRLGLAAEEATDLNARAMGPFKTLSEKYQHFRKELLVCKQESDLDDDFWRVMQQKAIAMSLPPDDADFLKLERLEALRAEAERTRQEAASEAEAQRQRQRQEQERLAKYGRAFEAIALDALGPESFAADEATFHQGLRGQLGGIDLYRGRLAEAQAFYRLNPQEAAALESRALDELYLQSRLL